MVDVVELWGSSAGRVRPDGAEWWCGSGYAVGGALVLTAAHVVAPEDRPLDVVRVRAPGGDLLDGRVIWHRPLDEIDAALVEVVDTRWTPPRRPVRWGRLFTHRSRQPFEAVGFPEVQASPRRRDTEQASGVVNPRTGAKAGWLALSVDDPPARVRDSASPWAGMSGAAAFCGRLLTAIVVGDPAGFESRRLLGLPVAVLLDDHEFVGLLREHGATPSVRAVELEPLTAEPPVATSPAALLRADLAATPFRGRPETDDLLAWARSDAAWSARLVVGPGGQGKTRLARHLAAQLEAEGWACVVLAETTSPGALAVLAEVTTRLLVVVDYAETRLAQLAELTRHLREAEPAVRVLFLARSAGSWRTAAAVASAHLEYLAVVPVVVLTALEPTVDGRRTAWLEVVTALAARLGEVEGLDGVAWRDHAAALVPPDLGGPRYRTILSVHLDALATLLGSATDEGEADHGEAAATVVLRHETRYWRTSAAARELAASDAVQLRSVTVATAWGAETSAEALAVLAALPGLQDQGEDHRREVADWLASLHPEPGRYWSRLQPDRLAEHLLAQVLVPGSPDPVAATAHQASERQVFHALTLLAQAAVNHPHLDLVIAALIAAHPARVGAVALSAAVRVERPAPLLNGLSRAVIQADPPTMEALHAHLPEQSLILSDLACDIVERRCEEQRPAAGRAATVVTAEFVRSLDELAARLAQVGRRTEALAAAHEAVSRSRELVDADRDAHLPALARSVNTLAGRLAEVGRRVEALAAAEEAVAVSRELADVRRDAHLADLARATNTLAVRLAEVSRPVDALAVARDAAAAYRELATRDREVHLPDMARSVNTLAIHLAETGRRVEALTAAQEAVRLRRELADANRDSYLPHLAASTHSLAARLAQAGHAREALDLARETVDLRRELVAAHRGAHLPSLAASLHALATHLAQVGRADEALGLAREAVAVRRELVEQHRGAHLPGLAASVHALATHLDRADETDEALAATDEAVRLGRELASAYREAYLPGLAASVQTLAGHLARRGRHRDALVALEEAVALRRELVERDRDVHLLALAIGLEALASSLSRDGREAEALVASREAVDLRRELLVGHHDVHAPGLAMSLGALGAQLARAGRWAEALGTAEDAVALLRGLTDRRGAPPRLAAALAELASRLARVGREEEAAGAALEALERGRVPGAHLDPAMVDELERLLAGPRDLTG